MAAPKCEIFSQGEEVVTGQTVDTNAAWLSSKLIEAGFDVTRHTSVGDHLTALVGLLKEIETRADCCICTGGLGPTGDDLTSEAVAAAFDVPLQLDTDALSQIEAMFANWKRPMPDVNRKQALLPQGSTRLDNKRGTAPGYALQTSRCLFFFLPGVPSEMREMFTTSVLPNLQNHFELTPRKRIIFRIFGLGESAIQELIDGIEIPETVTVSFRAGLPEVELKLWFPFDYPEAEQIQLIDQFIQALGDRLVCYGNAPAAGNGLLQEVGKFLEAEQGKVALVESISHGLLSSWASNSGWLSEGRVITGPAGVETVLGQPVESGCEAALVLAEKARQQNNVAYGLAQLWDFDSRSLDDTSSAVSVFSAISSETASDCFEAQLGGLRGRKVNVAAATLLDRFRLFLKDKAQDRGENSCL